MQDAGYINVEEHVLKLPVGPWPRDPRLKKCGLFEMANMIDGASGMVCVFGSLIRADKHFRRSDHDAIHTLFRLVARGGRSLSGRCSERGQRQAHPQLLSLVSLCRLA
jgi:hypothetical protein